MDNMTLKLKLFEIDFDQDTISFKVPHDIMLSTVWIGGYAYVDLSEILVGKAEEATRKEDSDE